MLELAIGIVTLLTVVAGWYFSKDKEEVDLNTDTIDNVNKVIRASKDIENLVNGLSPTERTELLKQFFRK